MNIKPFIVFLGIEVQDANVVSHGVSKMHGNINTFAANMNIKPFIICLFSFLIRYPKCALI